MSTQAIFEFVAHVFLDFSRTFWNKVLFYQRTLIISYKPTRKRGIKGKRNLDHILRLIVFYYNSFASWFSSYAIYKDVIFSSTPIKVLVSCIFIALDSCDYICYFRQSRVFSYLNSPCCRGNCSFGRLLL